MKSDLEKILNNPAIQRANEIANLIPKSVIRSVELSSKIPDVYSAFPPMYLELFSDLQEQLSAFDSSSDAGRTKTKELKTWVSENKTLLSAIEQTYDDISADQYDENSKATVFIEENTQSIEELSDKLPVNSRLKSKLKAAAHSLNYKNIKEVRDWLSFLLAVIGFIMSVS